jgi:hypothetical protein
MTPSYKIVVVSVRWDNYGNERITLSVATNADSLESFYCNTGIRISADECRGIDIPLLVTRDGMILPMHYFGKIGLSQELAEQIVSDVKSGTGTYAKLVSGVYPLVRKMVSCLFSE